MKGQKWTTFTPPAKAKCRRYRGRVLLRRSQFFEKFCDHLVVAGELETADRADYRGPASTGIRVDGYGGDPLQSDGTLNLIIADFQQSPTVGTLVGGEMNAIFQRLRRFLEKANDQAWRNRLEESSPGFGLADLIATRWTSIDRIRMFLISNRELSERVDGRQADSYDGKEVTYSVWDLKRLHRFVMGGREAEDIQIDLERDYGGTLPLLPAHLSADQYESYLAVIPGTTLAKIYDRWGARLLEQNVRVFLQARGNVNKGIRTTIESDPSMFFAYNNGITATAEAIETSEFDSTPQLSKLKNLQIVNGGQTTASIHVAYRNKKDLSNVFVQMKLSIVAPERAMDVVPKISEFANSQNRVNAADFFANHPFHVRTEEFSRRIFAPSPDGTFRESRWFYERARGQHADAKALLTPAQRKKFDLEHPRAQVFSKTDLAKFLNVWEGLPHTVSLGAQKNFAKFAETVGRRWKYHADDFNEGWFRQTVSKAIIFKATEKLISKQDWYEGGYRANIVAYGIAKLAHEVERLDLVVDFEMIWKKQSMSQSMEIAIARCAENAQEVLVNPPAGIRNISEWAKKVLCWERMKSKEVELPSAFIETLISRDEKKAADTSDKKEQRVLNGIEAQVVVVKAGAVYWKKALEFGRSRRLLTETEAGILSVLTRMPAIVPSEKQSERALALRSKMELEGFEALPVE